MERKLVSVLVGIGLVIVVALIMISSINQEAGNEKSELEMQKEALVERMLTDELGVLCAAVTSGINNCEEAPDPVTCAEKTREYLIALGETTECGVDKEFCASLRSKECRNLQRGQEECEKVVSVVNAANTKDPKRCAELPFEQYVMCSGIIAGEETGCFLARMAVEFTLSGELCEKNIENLSTAGKSYCESLIQ